MLLAEGRECFYEGGLRFGCENGCSRCCCGEPGYVWMSGEEAVAISRHLGLHITDFLERYTQDTPSGISFLDLEEKNWNCIMLGDDGRCSIYGVRPRQCRTYPFWTANLRSAEAWKSASLACPGIGRGRLYSREEIDGIVSEGAETAPGRQQSGEKNVGR